MYGFLDVCVCSNFDCDYGFTLGGAAAILVHRRKNGYLATVTGLKGLAADWKVRDAIGNHEFALAMAAVVLREMKRHHHGGNANGAAGIATPPLRSICGDVLQLKAG